MTENCSQRPASALAMSPWLWWTGLFLLLAFGPTSAVLSQEFPAAGPQYFSSMGDAISDADEAQAGPLYSDAFTGRTGQAMGALVRGGYLTGPTVGRQKGIAPLEIMPYAFLGDGMFFADIRGFRGDRGQFGSNLGLGYRQYIEPLDRIFGVNFFYDIDNTPYDPIGGKAYTFNQLGFGLETLGELFDIRANAYLPSGGRSQFLRNQLNDGTQHFVDHRLLYDITNFYLSSLKGMDAEIGIPLPGTFATRHDIRLFGGGYFYESDNGVDLAGGSARLQGNPIPSVQLQLQVTHDDIFSTNVMFGAQVSWGGYKQDPRERPSQFARMTTPIQRQYTISTTQTAVVVEDVVAFNESTGEDYFFAHVASYADPGGNGTVERPFQTIDQAVTNPANPISPGEIVFVHADSVYDGDATVELRPGRTPTNPAHPLETYVRYLGNGFDDSTNQTGFEVEHIITVPDVEIVTLPTRQEGTFDEDATNPGQRPLFTDTLGDGVHVASFSEFSGFRVGDAGDIGSGPTGSGVFGQFARPGDATSGPVQGVQLNQNVFAFAEEHGMNFVNAGSNINIKNTNILNPGLVGLRIEGGSPGITFGRTRNNANLGIIRNQVSPTGDPLQPSLLIFDTQEEASIVMQNDDAQAIDEAPFSGILEDSALISDIFNGISPLVDPAAVGSISHGIHIRDAQGFIRLGNATINGPQSHGIFFERFDGTLEGAGNVTIVRPAGEGILVQGLSGDIEFLRFNGDQRNRINILERQRSGITIRETTNTGSVFFNSDVLITWNDDTDIIAGNQAAVDWFNNAGQAGFGEDSTSSLPTTLTIAGSGGDGIALGIGGANTGNFRAQGRTAIRGNDDGAETDLINGIGINIANNTTTSSITFGRSNDSLATTIDDRFSQGILVEDNDGLVTFLGMTTVSNSAGSLVSAVEITNNPVAGDPAINGRVRFGGLTIEEAQQLLTDDIGAGLYIHDNPGRVTIGSFNANDTIGTSLYIRNAGNQNQDNPIGGVEIGGGSITGNTALPAVDIEDANISILLASVDSADSATQGIRLVDFFNFTAGQEFDFQISIDEPDPDFDGGTIEGAADEAILIDNRANRLANLAETPVRGRVSINNMTIEDNRVGVVSWVNELLDMNGNQIITNSEDGVRAIDTRVVDIEGSIDPNDDESINIINFDSNGTADDEDAAVRYHQVVLISRVNNEVASANVDQSIQYDWNLENNRMIHDLTSAAVLATNRYVVDAGNVITFDNTLTVIGDGLELNTDANAPILFVQDGDDIELQISANIDEFDVGDFEFNSDFDELENLNPTPMGTFVNWSGVIVNGSSIEDSNFLLDEGGAIAIAVRETSNDGSVVADIDIVRNNIVGNEGYNVGIYGDAERSQAEFLITDNTITFADTINLNDLNPPDVFDLGIFIENLDVGSQVTISDNVIDITSNRAEGISFNDPQVANTGFNGNTRGLSFYTIEGNEISLTAISADDNQLIGINLSNPIGEVDLEGTDNNSVIFVNTTNGIDVIFGGNFTDTIIVNGIPVP